MWLIVESNTARKQLRKCPKIVISEYETWKLVVEHSGPKSLMKISGYRDHALKGEWRGARSSYLSKKWRVIYHVDKNKIEIQVLEVNPHDYRKKG